MSNQEQTGGSLYFPFMAGFYDNVSGLAHPMIRVFAGLILMPHGAQKIFEWFGGNTAGTAGFFSKVGLEPALPLVYVTGGVEFFGGFLLAIGLFTRMAAGAIVILMLVAIIYVNSNSGYFWLKGGYEFPMLWGIVALGYFFSGGGKFSVDAKIGREL